MSSCIFRISVLAFSFSASVPRISSTVSLVRRLSCSCAPVDDCTASRRSGLQSFTCSKDSLTVAGKLAASSIHSSRLTFHFSTLSLSPTNKTPLAFFTTVSPELSRSSANLDGLPSPPVLPLPLPFPLTALSYSLETTSGSASTKHTAKLLRKLLIWSLAFSWFALSPVILTVAGKSSSSFRMMFTLIFVLVSVSIFCTFLPLAPIRARAVSLSMLIVNAEDKGVVPLPEVAPVVALSSGISALMWVRQAATSFADPWMVTKLRSL
mmetsp:Transcript_59865/g.139462  ORF Transcript_59865/g.139462 Transcript_59865/m.139462 type:complete len:266 (+) Transcript_59865:810-1607(+)